MELSRWGSAGLTTPNSSSSRKPFCPAASCPSPMWVPPARPPRRSVLPARLVFKGRDWYLQGFCLERGGLPHPQAHPDAGVGAGRPLSAPPLSPAHRGWRAAGGLLRACPPALLPRPCLPVLRRIRRGLRHPRGGRQPCGVGKLPGRIRGSMAICSPSAWGWRYWNRSACGNGWRCWREKWRRTTETMTRGVRITVIGWSHLNHRRNLT